MQNQTFDNWLPLFLFRSLIVMLAAISTYVLAIYSRSEADVVVTGMGILCLVLVSIPLFVRRDYSLFEPLTFVILLVAFGTTIKLIYVLTQLTANNGYVVERLLKNGGLDSFVGPMTVVTAGWVCFVIGYTWKFRTTYLDRVFLPSRNEWRGPRLQAILIVLSVISVAFFVAFFIANGISFSSMENLSAKRFSDSAGSAQGRLFNVKYYMYRGAALSKFVVYLTLIWMLYRKSKITSWVGLWCVGAFLQTCMLSFVMSNRAGIVLLCIDCLVITYYMQQKLNMKRVALAMVFVFALMIPILGSRVKSQHSVTDLVEKTMVGRDMLDITKTCHIINAVPGKMDYKYGECLYGWMAAPIPKSIWPNKPMWVECGPFVHQHVYGDRTGVAGIPPGLVGDFYWGFGLLGVWGGLFAMGVLFRQLFVAFLPHSTNPTSVLIYTMIVTRFGMFSMGGDLGTGIIKCGLDLVPLLLVLAFVSYRGRPADGSSAPEDTSNEFTSHAIAPTPVNQPSHATRVGQVSHPKFSSN